jgi:hypothetical protein
MGFVFEAQGLEESAPQMLGSHPTFRGAIGGQPMRSPTRNSNEFLTGAKSM